MMLATLNNAELQLELSAAKSALLDAEFQAFDDRNARRHTSHWLRYDVDRWRSRIDAITAELARRRSA